MQLPVDFKALFEEMTNIKSAQAADLSVGIYIENSAPADLVAHVRGAFASPLPSVRLTLSYLDSSFKPYAGDDIAIIVAGSSRVVGAAAAALRASGVPTMVITTLPATVERIASEGTRPIPEGDIVAPCAGNEDDEPFELDEKLASALDERIGAWIASVCQDKRLAFSAAFPFMRRALAKDSVATTSLQNAGIGLVPFIPGADLPVMTLNQAKMVLQIAAAYGQEMTKDRAKELAAVVGGAYVCRTLARELVEFVPVLGFAVKPVVAYGGTTAIGNAVIEYYEGGGDAAGLANVASRATGFASKWITKLRNNPGEAVADACAAATAKAPAVREKVEVAVPKARDFVAEKAPKAKALVTEYAPQAAELAREYAPQATDLAREYAPKAVDAVVGVVSSAFSNDKLKSSKA